MCCISTFHLLFLDYNNFQFWTSQKKNFGKHLDEKNEGMDLEGLWEFKKYFWRLGFLQVINNMFSVGRFYSTTH
jgi:hypothetical protein